MNTNVTPTVIQLSRPSIFVIKAPSDSVITLTPAFSLVSKPLRDDGSMWTAGFAAILDIDARGDSVLVLGALADRAGRWAPDGAMAWIVSSDTEPRAVHFSEAGAGSDAVSRCGLLDVGAVRYLDDGSYVVVPGVEPGVFHYGSDGRLIRVWQTASLGLAGGCPFSVEESRQFGPTPEPRWAWWNRNTLVDDVISVGDVPGLVVRHHQRGQTTWGLVLMDGTSIRRLRLPIESPSGLTRARADFRDGILAVLLHESGRMESPPIFAPRVVFLQLGPSP